MDRRSDIFSLTTTLWELIADRRLFKSDNDGETVRVIREANVPDPTAFVPEYPSLLWLVLRRALAREPDDRYATAGELARDLDGVARRPSYVGSAGSKLALSRFGPSRGVGARARCAPRRATRAEPVNGASAYRGVRVGRGRLALRSRRRRSSGDPLIPTR